MWRNLWMPSRCTVIIDKKGYWTPAATVTCTSARRKCSHHYITTVDGVSCGISSVYSQFEEKLWDTPVYDPIFVMSWLLVIVIREESGYMVFSCLSQLCYTSTCMVTIWAHWCMLGGFLKINQLTVPSLVNFHAALYQATTLFHSSNAPRVS